MVIEKLMRELIGEEYLAANPATVDGLRFGDYSIDASKVGVCFIASADVLRAAKEWGAELLITHEPTFYDHSDRMSENPASAEKLALAEKCGITICRYHDSMHWRGADMVSEAFLERLGWNGDFDGVTLFKLASPMSPLDIVRDIEKKLDIAHVRIVGARGGSVTRICLFLGHRGWDMWKPFQTDENELAIGGELCEWHDCEAIRDASQLGHQKTALILGHAGSERFSMETVADNIKKAHPELSVKYFDSGELYTYSD